MHHLQAGELQEPGAGEVRALPDAGGAVGQLVRIGLDVGDQFSDRLDARGGMRRHDVRNPDHVADRLQLVGLVGHVAEDAVGDRVRTGIADQDDVAVRLPPHGLGSADGAAAAGAVFHHRGLAPGGLQMRGQQSSHHVGAATSGCRHDEPDGSVGRQSAPKARPRQNCRCRNGCGAGQHAASSKGSASHKFTPCLAIACRDRRQCAPAGQAGALAQDFRAVEREQALVKAEQLEQRRQGS